MHAGFHSWRLLRTSDCTLRHAHDRLSCSLVSKNEWTQAVVLVDPFIAYSMASLMTGLTTETYYHILSSMPKQEDRTL